MQLRRPSCALDAQTGLCERRPWVTRAPLGSALEFVVRALAYERDGFVVLWVNHNLRASTRPVPARTCKLTKGEQIRAGGFRNVRGSKELVERKRRRGYPPWNDAVTRYRSPSPAAIPAGFPGASSQEALSANA
jgi:hypothetical protein